VDRRIAAVRDKAVYDAHVRVDRTGDAYTVELEGPWGVVRETGRDAFEALARARTNLELQGWWLAVQGARRDTYPSGMSREMGGGFLIYVMRNGVPATERVATFDDAPLDRLATVEEQRAAYESWRKSLR
jgi:hypothetical protein